MGQILCTVLFFNPPPTCSNKLLQLRGNQPQRTHLIVWKYTFLLQRPPRLHLRFKVHQAVGFLRLQAASQPAGSLVAAVATLDVLPKDPAGQGGGRQGGSRGRRSTRSGQVRSGQGQLPAVDDGAIWLPDGELQLLHVRPTQADSTVPAVQRHQNQPGLLAARHHLTVLGDHQPLPATHTRTVTGPS